MGRGIHVRLGIARRAGAALAGLLAATPVIAAENACVEPMQPMQRVEMIFGRNIGGKLGVGEAAWSRFLRDEVTARFPNGLSVIDAAGQWSDSGRVMREPS